MYINFKSLKFKNILSYGNKVTEFDFSEGLNSIVGRNGHGKSTFLDALSFCLYGQPYRKIKLKELINRINKKSLWVQCTFEVQKSEYQITRTLGPDKIEILKNGEPIELLSAKRLIQDEINRILGIDYNMFRYVICLAVNYNKPFLSLSLGEKRDLTESMFSIKVFGDMLKKLKKNNSENKVRHEIIVKSVALLKNEVESIEDQIEEIKTAIANFDQTKSDDINRVYDSIKKYQLRVEKSKSNIDVAQKALDKLEIEDVSDIRKKLENKNKSLVLKSSRISDINSTLKHLDSNDRCMHCNNELTPEYKEHQEIILSQELEKLEAETASLKKDISDLKKDITKQEKTMEKKNTIENALEREEDKKSLLENEIERLENELTEVKNRTIDFDLKKLEKRYDSKSKEYKKLSDELIQVDEEMNYNKIIAGLLSEQGIKAHFFKKLIPILNSKINSYLEKFELPIVLTFDELMNEKLVSANGKNHLTYMGHSEGEKKRIDISILLAFIDTMKTISNWQCNLLFLDEMLDSATDKDGLEKILYTIKSMTDENSKLCVYLISHRMVDENVFNQKISISKVGSFSHISNATLEERNNE